MPIAGLQTTKGKAVLAGRTQDYAMGVRTDGGIKFNNSEAIWLNPDDNSLEWQSLAHLRQGRLRFGQRKSENLVKLADKARVLCPEKHLKRYSNPSSMESTQAI
jgi:hypothetical protein